LVGVVGEKKQTHPAFSYRWYSVRIRLGRTEDRRRAGQDGPAGRRGLRGAASAFIVGRRKTSAVINRASVFACPGRGQNQMPRRGRKKTHGPEGATTNKSSPANALGGLKGERGRPKALGKGRNKREGSDGCCAPFRARPLKRFFPGFFGLEKRPFLSAPCQRLGDEARRATTYAGKAIRARSNSRPPNPP